MGSPHMVMLQATLYAYRLSQCYRVRPAAVVPSPANMRLRALILSVSTFFAGIQAFDAGTVGDESWMKDRAYRHGDIEKVFNLFVQYGGTTGRVPLSQKWKLDPDDEKRLYFGNWLRDYSQVLDWRTLEILNEDLIMGVLEVYAYFSSGYGGGEFEITKQRLGVYRPEEHIDNPTGYANGKDVRKYDPRLRGPVDPMEVKIDPTSAMKNYIKRETGGWATSSLHIKRLLVLSINAARKFRVTGDWSDRDDAYRELGSALHTLEDFLAHSNWIELAMILWGFADVFPHVGTETLAFYPKAGRLYPLVTGTFGSADATQSLLNGIQDSLRQASTVHIPELLSKHQQVQRETEKDALAGAKYAEGSIDRIEALMRDIAQEAAEASGCPVTVRGLDSLRVNKRDKSDAEGVCQLPTLDGEYWDFARNFDSQDFVNHLDDDTYDDEGRRRTPLRMAKRHTHLSAVGNNSTFRPRILERGLTSREAKKAKKLRGAIEKIIRLRGEVVKEMRHVHHEHRHTPKWHNLESNIHIWILREISPILKPLLTLSLDKLQELSNALMDLHDSQFAPWDDPKCTNPTHSFLSKDHFENILNEPAGRIAQTVSAFVMNIVIQAWEDDRIDVNAVAEQATEALFHPGYFKKDSPLQRAMMNVLREWFFSHPKDQQQEIVKRLGRDNVRNHANVRFKGQMQGKWQWSPAVYQ